MQFTMTSIYLLTYYYRQWRWLR